MKTLQCIFCYIGIGILCIKLWYSYDKKYNELCDDDVYVVGVFIWPLVLLTLFGPMFVKAIIKIIKE